ncbi:TPA: PD-(D/E)XK motif protein [Stenotrophomonas maltophilia]
MNSSLEEVWHSAVTRQAAAAPSSHAHVIFRTDDSSRVGTFGGVDSSGNLLFAVETTSPPPAVDIRSNSIDYFRQQRPEVGSWLMFLRLKDAELRSVFSRLCCDLIESISDCPDDKAVIAETVSRIRLWQKLFNLRPDGLLDPHEVKGLTAELLFLLKQLRAGRLQSDEIVLSWLGPTGSDQDYIFSTESFEIKAVSPSAELVSISSLQKLQSDRALSLSIWTLRQAAPTEPQAWTLNALVLKAESHLADSPTALGTFRDRLLSAGYVHHALYDSIAYESLAEETFQVEGDFPRITESDVPTGIVTASYSISLHSIRAARSPAHG